MYIDHGGGLVTGYGHASSLLVQAGERVKKGQVIALVAAPVNVPGRTYTSKFASTVAPSTRCSTSAQAAIDTNSTGTGPIMKGISHSRYAHHTRGRMSCGTPCDAIL